MEILFQALGWRALVGLGPAQRSQRLMLLAWACAELNELPTGPIPERLAQLAALLPLDFTDTRRKKAASR
jgi:hypothetical protein